MGMRQALSRSMAFLVVLSLACSPPPETDLSLERLEEVLDSEGYDAAEQFLVRLQEDENLLSDLDGGALVALAQEHLDQGNHQTMISFLRLNTAFAPETMASWASLADGYIAAGERTLALESLSRAREMEPSREWEIYWVERKIEYIDEFIGAFDRETDLPQQHVPGENTEHVGDYLGQEPPGLEPKVFAPGIVSVIGRYDFSITFSPDGNELYFTRHGHLIGDNTIYASYRSEEGWTAPEALFEGAEPFISLDNSKMFHSGGGVSIRERSEDGWGDPVLLFQGMFSTLSEAGNLYTSAFEGSSVDVAMCTPDGEGFSEPVVLGSAINSEYMDAHPLIAPDESYVIFDSDKPTARGDISQLYISFRQENGEWGQAQPLPRSINSGWDAMTPSISPDGRYLFYHSNGDIYWVSTEILNTVGS